MTALVFMLGVGLVGVTMNPAMATRVHRAAGNAGPLVNTAHTSFITFGVVLGSSLGGLAIDAYGLRAPLWLGAGLAACGLLTLLPERRRRPATPKAPETPCQGQSALAARSFTARSVASLASLVTTRAYARRASGVTPPRVE